METIESSRSRKKREISQTPTRKPKRRRLVKGPNTRRTKGFGYIKCDALNDEAKSKIE